MDVPEVEPDPDQHPATMEQDVLPYAELVPSDDDRKDKEPASQPCQVVGKVSSTLSSLSPTRMPIAAPQPTHQEQWYRSTECLKLRNAPIASLSRSLSPGLQEQDPSLRTATRNPSSRQSDRMPYHTVIGDG